MGEGLISRRGGGGARLNYKVVGGTSAPTNPVANTIWVNTSTTISSHVFSATQPTNPVAGMVWLQPGTTATAPINVLKKGTVMVYPNACKQYVSGAWVVKTAKTWQNNKWVEWRIYLFNAGVDNTALTGGYEGTGSYGKVKVEDGVIFTYSSSSDKTGSSRTIKAVDLTSFNTIYFEVDSCTGSSGKVAISDDGSTASADLDFYTAVATSSTPTLYNIDISSATGSYHIVMTQYGSTSKGMKVSAIYME